MSDLFKIPVTQYWLYNAWIDANGNPCDEATPGARFKAEFRVKKGVPGARKVKTKSTKWYGRINGKRVALSENKEAARIMMGERMKKAALRKAGAVDPFEEHNNTPLKEHLDDHIVYLEAKNGVSKGCLADKNCISPERKRVRARILAVLDGCGFVYPPDLNHSRMQEFLANLQRDRQMLPPLPPGESFTKKVAAAALQVTPDGFLKLVRAHKLASTGDGKARRYPRETVAFLWERAARGCSVQTANHYLAVTKSFVRWMVKDRRIADNPLAHVSRGNVKLDRRHDRRPLSIEEIRALIGAAKRSKHTFRGISGDDRSALYAVACVTGFRAAELAHLVPSSFDLDAPTATLPATATKNGRTAIQPLPEHVVGMLSAFLAGKPADRRVWPGTWHTDAAEMLRIDLEAAGIAYIVDGPDGPLYAGFHCLRHSQIGLLDASGATLKEAMQLARHSDPKLTMARYGRKQLHDLGRAIDRLPSLLSAPAALKATGTEG